MNPAFMQQAANIPRGPQISPNYTGASGVVQWGNNGQVLDRPNPFIGAYPPQPNNPAITPVAPAPPPPVPFDPTPPHVDAP